MVLGRLGVFVVVVTALGCGGRPSPVDGFDDGGNADAGVLDFCQGPARAEVNGAALAVEAVGEMMYLDCCEAAGVAFAPVGAGHRILVSWRHSGGPSPTLPITLDLASPPSQWGVSVTVDCDPQTGCGTSGSLWSGQLQGTLTVTTLDQYPYTAYDMTLCLQGVEDEAAPQPTVHSLRLWAAHVVAQVNLK